MAAIKRSADVVWEGTIARGEGELSGGSGALAGLPVSAASRFGELEGKTTPEELIAAAHATCFTMALGSVLAREHTPPERLAVNAVVTLEEVEGKYTITSSELEAVGRVAASTRRPSRARQRKRSRPALSRVRWPGVSRSVRTAGSSRACKPPAKPWYPRITLLKEGRCRTRSTATKSSACSARGRRSSSRCFPKLSSRTNTYRGRSTSRSKRSTASARDSSTAGAPVIVYCHDYQ
jgi:osmotically inducible protein OsmC